MNYSEETVRGERKKIITARFTCSCDRCSYCGFMIVVKKPQVEFLLLLILWRKPIKILINVVTEHDAPAFMELITTYTPNGSVMDQVISGLKHAQKYVLNGVTSTLSNGPIEGLICKIKTLKKMVMDFLNGSIVS